MIKVYSKKNCQPCLMTKRFLMMHDIQFEEVDATESVAKELAGRGFKALPVVEAKGKVWEGFRPDIMKTTLLPSK